MFGLIVIKVRTAGLGGSRRAAPGIGLPGYLAKQIFTTQEAQGDLARVRSRTHVPHGDNGFFQQCHRFITRHSSAGKSEIGHWVAYD